MASHKITKLAGAKPTDEFELSIAQALVDLENNVADLKKELRPLSITAAKEVMQHNPFLSNAIWQHLEYILKSF